MLSNKWTFSLTSLILILAFCLVAPVMAQDFDINLGLGAGEDVSFADGNQVIYGDATAAAVTINIMSTKVVNHHETATAATAAADPAVVSGTALGADDFTVTAYNAFGGVVTTDAPTLGTIENAETPDGIHFTANLSGIAATTNITKVIIDLKEGVVSLADPRVTEKNKSKKKDIVLEYVGPTEGTAIGTITDGAFTASSV